MKRVRFLTHVMGVDTPAGKCFMAGEVAWVEGDLYDHLARQRTFGGEPWCVDSDAETVDCRWCRREFASDAIEEHRRFFHLERPKVERYECGCGRDFGTLKGLRIHQGHMHRETDHEHRSGTGPP